jgi:hypothetical protein
MIKELCLRRDRPVFYTGSACGIDQRNRAGSPRPSGSNILQCKIRSPPKRRSIPSDYPECPGFPPFLLKYDLFAPAKKIVDFETIGEHILQCGMSRP